MKKVFVILCVLVVIFGCVGCGEVVSAPVDNVDERAVTNVLKMGNEPKAVGEWEATYIWWVSEDTFIPIDEIDSSASLILDYTDLFEGNPYGTITYISYIGGEHTKLVGDWLVTSVRDDGAETIAVIDKAGEVVTWMVCGNQESCGECVMFDLSCGEGDMYIVFERK